MKLNPGMWSSTLVAAEAEYEFEKHAAVGQAFVKFAYVVEANPELYLDPDIRAMYDDPEEFRKAATLGFGTARKARNLLSSLGGTLSRLRRSAPGAAKRVGGNIAAGPGKAWESLKTWATTPDPDAAKIYAEASAPRVRGGRRAGTDTLAGPVQLSRTEGGSRHRSRPIGPGNPEELPRYTPGQRQTTQGAGSGFAAMNQTAQELSPQTQARRKAQREAAEARLRARGEGTSRREGANRAERASEARRIQEEAYGGRPPEQAAPGMQSPPPREPSAAAYEGVPAAAAGGVPAAAAGGVPAAAAGGVPAAAAAAAGGVPAEVAEVAAREGIEPGDLMAWLSEKTRQNPLTALGLAGLGGHLLSGDDNQVAPLALGAAGGYGLSRLR